MRNPFLLSLLLILSGISATAQRVHTGVTLITGLAAKADITGSNKAAYGLKSAPQFCFEGLFNVYGRLGGEYWLMLGLGAGVVGHNFDYNIPGSAFNPPLSYNVDANGALSRETDLVYIKVPIALEKRWLMPRNRVWNASAGASLLYTPPMDMTSTAEVMHNGSPYQYLRMQKNGDNLGRPWLNYHVAGGYGWRLRWGHVLRANLQLSLSFTDYGSGTYEFTLPDQPGATGRYGVSGSYVGVAVGYLFGRW